MKKHITAWAAMVALAITSTSASAQSWFAFEAGVGASTANKTGDGVWYWSSMQHKTPVNSFAGRVGLQFNLVDAEPKSWIPGMRMHAAFNYMGHLHWTSVAGEDAPPDHSYGLDVATNTCYNQNCGYRREFNSTGDMMAFSLTIEPYWNLGSDWTVGIEAGPALYRYTWTSFATNLQNSPGHFGPYDTAGAVETFRHAPHWYPGALVGASVGYKNWSIRYNYLYSPSKWEDGVPSGVKGVHLLTIGYVW